MGRDIVGRTLEKKIMRQLLDNDKSDFLAMYGRRRVGKTFLIREFYKKHTVFHCSGINSSSMEDQLDIFYESLMTAGVMATGAPQSWLEAFRAVKLLIDSKKSKKKKVIFLDEVSWLDTPRSKFVPALSHFWNTYCELRNDIILVVCGSVSTWIMDNILNNRGELHNRHTKKIRLKPFSLYETEVFLKSRRVKLVRKDICTLYMLIGGIPYYLDAISPGRSISQIMDDLFFGKSAALANEYENLYPALFKNAENHMEVVEALSSKNAGLTRQEILKSITLKSGGTFTKVLTELTSCEFVKKLYPIDKRSEGAVYRLVDEYSIFYHKYIKTKSIKSGKALAASRSFNAWSGFAFENLCIRHSDHVAHGLGVSGTDYEVFTFKSSKTKDHSGMQIDLIIDRTEATHIIEAKYYKDEYKLTADEAKKIRNRITQFQRKTKSKKSIFVTLISPYGALKNEHYLAEVTNQLIVDQLFIDLEL